MNIKRIISFILIVLCVLPAASCGLLTTYETTEQTAEAETEGTRPEITSPEPVTLAPIISGDPTETETDEPETEKETDKQTETETETEAQTTEAETEPYANELGFKVDLSAYEKYMDPEDKDAYLILVNPDNPVGKDYKPDDLEPLVDTRSDRSKRYMRLYAAKSLEAFLKEARANGCKDVTVTSAYRSYESQKEIFDGDVERFIKQGMTREEAIAKERLDTAYPGESEHQTGLAVDMHNLSSAQLKFKDTYEAQWLAENAWKFGFILRYMPGKEEITTYTYEPWHFRFVGRYHAKRIYEMGMCLEEYLEFLKTE